MPRSLVQVSVGSESRFLFGRLKRVVANLSCPKFLGRSSSRLRIWSLELPLISFSFSFHFARYFLKAVHWARKYGIRINLDLHTLPGSQNGFNHSGRQGVINFLNDYMGIANAQRALEYIRVITEFISCVFYLVLFFVTPSLPLGHLIIWNVSSLLRILDETRSQPEYSHVALWSIANEARTAVIGKDVISHL